MSLFLSVITPIYNSASTLRDYLDALFESDYPRFESIIVDDQSADSGPDILKSFPVSYHKLSHRMGSANARNHGAGFAKGDILVFIDPDVRVRSHTLKTIAESFEQDPQIAGLICSYDDSPGGKRWVSQFKFLYHHYIHQQQGRYVNLFWTGCSAVKKKVFDDLGGFDAHFFKDFNSINDIEFGYRLSVQKMKIFNAKHIQVQHLKELSFLEWLITDFLRRGFPWVKIMKKYKNYSFNFNFSSPSSISACCAWLAMGSMVFSFFDFYFLLVTLGLWMVIFLANYRAIQFFKKKKGPLFSIYSFFMLWIYYLNCGASFIAGLFFHSEA